MPIRIIRYIQELFLFVISNSVFHCIPDPSSIKHILLLRTAALGDFLFAVPAMVQVRKRFPHTKITLLTATTTTHAHKAIVETYAGGESLPWLSFMVPSVIDEAICIRSFNLKTLWTEYREKVRGIRPDVAVILAHTGEPGMRLLKKILFLRFLGVRCIILGWRVSSTIGWFRERQYKDGRFEHHVFGPLRSVAELPGMPEVEEMEVTFPLQLDSSARNWVEELWKERGWPGKRVIAIAPGSLMPHKRWPIENYIALCRELSNLNDLIMVVIGTVADRPLGERLVEAMGGAVLNLAGETTLSQSAALLERCALMVGNDGGAAHLGSAMGCPVVSIVPGIEYPGSVEPFFSRELAVRHPIYCAPCYSFSFCPEKHNKCMVCLPVPIVYESCKRAFLEDGCSKVKASVKKECIY